MLTFHGTAAAGFCDGVTRRDFLRSAAWRWAGCRLPQLLAAEAKAGIGSPHKAVIMVFLAGGPPHQDMFDLKPDAPRRSAASSSRSPTNVPGIEICEHMPRLAPDDGQVRGHPLARRRPAASTRPPVPDRLHRRSQPGRKGGRPSLGCGPLEAPGAGRPGGAAVRRPLAPDGARALGRPRRARLPRPGPRPVHPATAPDAGRAWPLRGHQPPAASTRPPGACSASFDDLRRDVDANGAIDGMDAFTQRAFDILTSSKLVEALDLTKEDPRLRDRYGIGDMKNDRRRPAPAASTTS